MRMEKYKSRKIRKNTHDWLDEFDERAITDNDIITRILRNESIPKPMTVDEKIDDIIYKNIKGKNNLMKLLEKSSSNDFVYTDNMRHCDVCGKEFSDKPFENINAAGESLISKIELYDMEYTCCPNCTNKLYNWVHRKYKEKG